MGREYIGDWMLELCFGISGVYGEFSGRQMLMRIVVGMFGEEDTNL